MRTVFAALLALYAGGFTSAQNSRPNIVIIYANDPGGSWSTIQTKGPLAADRTVLLSQFELPENQAFFRISVSFESP